MRKAIPTVAVAAVLTFTAHALADAPPLWTDLEFAEAREKAAAEERVLLVYATASWCPPCRMMERSTWQSEAVLEWFAKHGVAYKLDVDHERDLAQAHDVEFMPTLIAYRHNEPFDRIGGYKSDQEVLAWLENVREGKREVDAILEAAGERVGPEGRVDVHARLNLARTLAQGGAMHEATEEYLWLWDNMLDHQPSMYGVRLSFMISDMERLARRHAPAKEAFRERRAEYWPRLKDGTATLHDVADWTTLATVVGEEDSLLEWFDSVKDEPGAHGILRGAELSIKPMLIERGRWADVAVFYPADPVEHMRQLFEADRRMDERDLGEHEAMRAHMRSVHRQMRRDNASQMYAVLLAARRDAQANGVADLLLEHDDSTAARGALVKAALEAGEVRLRQLQWIDEAEEMGARVPRARRQVTEALARQTG